MRSRPRILPALTAALAGLALALACAASASAATITVNTTEDTSLVKCGLRDAIEAANSNTTKGGCTPVAAPGTDTIDFALPAASTITLTGAPDSFTGDVRVLGPGAGQLTISGGGAHRVFEVGSASVEISGLTITDGASEPMAGAIYSVGTTTLEGVLLTGSVAAATGGANAFPQGGAIVNTGTMKIIGSTIAENESVAIGAANQNSAVGGGIYNAGSGSLTIEGSTVRGNVARGNGTGGAEGKAIGAGISNAGTLIIVGSTISGNEALASSGNAFNIAEGGGLSNANAGTTKVSLARSTVAGNIAAASGEAASSAGGAMTVYGSSFLIDSVTIAGNSAGIGANLSISAAVTIENTIVAKPLGGSNCQGSATSAGYNLTDASGCGFSQPTDKTDTDPLLSPAGLADNGGPTQTIALLDGSAAIDQGLRGTGEATDQRGLTRPVEIPGVANAPGGDGTDIGAFEVQLPPPPETGGSTQPPGASTGPIPSTPAPAPTVTIKGLAPTTHKRDLKIRFISSVPGSSFRCKLDGKPYKTCRPPFRAKGLNAGRHRFSVIATSPAGISGKPAKKSFRVLGAR